MYRHVDSSLRSHYQQSPVSLSVYCDIISTFCSVIIRVLIHYRHRLQFLFRGIATLSTVSTLIRVKPYYQHSLASRYQNIVALSAQLLIVLSLQRQNLFLSVLSPSSFSQSTLYLIFSFYMCVLFIFTQACHSSAFYVIIMLIFIFFNVSRPVFQRQYQKERVDTDGVSGHFIRLLWQPFSLILSSTVHFRI